MGLIRPLPTPDGIIPTGTSGTVLEVFGGGAAYLVEFEGSWIVPETVRADAFALCDPDNPPLTGKEAWGSGQAQIMARVAAYEAKVAARNEPEMPTTEELDAEDGAQP